MSNRKKEILKLYKQCLKSVYGIPSQEQRKIWLIDTRRKFKENKTLLDASRISNAIREGWDELQWMNKLHDLREGKQSTQPSKEITKAQIAAGMKDAGPASQELRVWLRDILPHSPETDLDTYVLAFQEDGFDSPEMLRFLQKNDLTNPPFRKAHARAILDALKRKHDA
mmetsp:Transcript_32490/g.41573  ORF Transcript_32490/g.41573 Transcript_32490/m.41573 type:complete len:169 (+) Transcript_32490:55-561(+)|eukprot:CAMPEP_0117881858 /NCGR_PEP_ID=MMETSP0950-20121206/17107_1 /TAXON_ID=44440 /ORGANISM="Chattonella subsalsa, Strain CCMP2191" /LENGTH=168 /DNA_ID=CAMNT_0005737259 /DNA_START=151 /DNA_END=657 /DNA_ORIENTATION=+